jgi:23S rRNA pseudouridine1911/1915/1917 synthase
MSRVVRVTSMTALVRLDVFLAESMDMSRSAVQRIIKLGLVEVNGSQARASYILEHNDNIVIREDKSIDTERPVVDLEVVYEDNDLIVINKPAGMIVEAGNGRTDEPTVVDFARNISTDADRSGIVHRLDRETSGLLVIAKTSEAKVFLQSEWKGRRVKKTYLALLVGRIEPEKAVIKLPLDRDPAHPTRRHVATNGKPAITNYARLLDFTGYSFVKAKPETGRTHQLRVHFAAMGHPIVGDVVYGNKKRPLGLTRQFLHASGLEFTSPSGKIVKLEIPLPNELQEVLEELQNELY